MRRAKDSSGFPLPITERDREELHRFERFLNDVSARMSVLGSTRRDAVEDAYEANYPEDGNGDG